MQVLFDTLGRMIRSPLPSFIAVMVLAIAIALPLLLFSFVDSLDGVEDRWEGAPSISLFLKLSDGDTDDSTMAFANELAAIPGIERIEYISPSEALLELRQKSEFAGVLNGLSKNPLPPLLVVYPDSSLGDEALGHLVSSLGNRPEIDTMSYDQQWVLRLTALTLVFEQILAVLAILMGAGIVLIVSNTARIEILSRKDEIAILDQIGATHGFIRRPFLYFGALQGVFGAIFALIITNIAIFAVAGPINDLAELYDTDFTIRWIGFLLALSVVAVSGTLGWLAARITIAHYLLRNA